MNLLDDPSFAIDLEAGFDQGLLVVGLDEEEVLVSPEGDRLQVDLVVEVVFGQGDRQLVQEHHFNYYKALLAQSMHYPLHHYEFENSFSKEGCLPC